MRVAIICLAFIFICTPAYATWYGPRVVTIPIVDDVQYEMSGKAISLVQVIYISSGNACPEADISIGFSPYFANTGKDINLISLSNIKVDWDSEYNITLDITNMKELPDDFKHYGISKADLLIATISSLRENTVKTCGNIKGGVIKKDILQDSTLTIKGIELHKELTNFKYPKHLHKR